MSGKKEGAPPATIAPEPEVKKSVFILGCDSSFNATTRQDALKKVRFFPTSDYTGG